MIQKVLPGEYLKRYGAMTAQERESYRKRVGEWLHSDGARLLTLTDRPMAKAQNMVQMSTRWSKEDCQALHNGAVLMTPLMEVAETWLPSQLWAKSAWRGVRQIVSVLSEVESEAGAVGKGHAESAEIRRKADSVKAPVAKPKAITPDKQDNKPSKTQKKEENISAISAISAGQKTKPKDTQPAKVTAPSLAGRAGGGSPVPVRPKHIDQYVHLLPEATQKKAATVQGLLRDLDQARENARLLMNDGHASGNDVARWAKAATMIDGKLKGIYQELDREWEKLVKEGRVVVDDLGQAHATAPQNGTAQDNTAPAELTSEQKHRRRELRKWLIDLRRGGEGKAREKRIEQWKVNWKEYLTLEPREAAMQDGKIVEAAKHFGIDLDSL